MLKLKQKSEKKQLSNPNHFKESLPFGLRRRPHRDLTVSSLYPTKVVPTASPTMATMPYSGLAVRLPLPDTAPLF